ncbi:MAG: hypothetical protein IKG14_04345 [Clostridia bacterium]|nr:hypothetical protein [Clostridia bacterium]
MQDEVCLVVTEEEYHIIVNALNELRTRCIKENIDTTDVDYLLLNIIDGKKQKDVEKVRGDGYDAR